MLISKKLSKNTYNKLIDYISTNCNAYSLEKYCNQHQKDSEKVINIIFKSKKYTLMQLLLNHDKQDLEKIYFEFKNNDEIFDNEYIKYFEQYNRNEKNEYYFKENEYNRKTTIIDSIYWLTYNNLAKEWIKNHKNEYIKEKRDDYSTIYYFKLTETFKQELLQCNSFFDWIYPEKMDNICFYKNNKCWLFSVAHEQICDIYCDNKEEYDYLKSIGIEFIEKEYTPEKCIPFTKY